MGDIRPYLPYNPGMSNRQPRDFTALERRRKQAARLFAKGETVLASVARQLKVTRQSAFRWYQQWRRGGSGALKAAGRAGRKPRLTASQLGRVEAALMKGARHHGFSADLWTLPRVATVVERVTGVKYHPGHVWKVLGSMHWTVQKPERQAKERDESKVQYWKEVRWPEIKKTLSASAPGSSSRTNPVSPNNRRSEPRGHRAGKRRS
jgi:transposase